MKMRNACFALVMSVLALGASADSWSRMNAQKLLLRWCDAFVSYQIKEHADPMVRGALLCPACGLAHGRIADAVYPLVYCYVQTGRREYLDSAVRAVDWVEQTMVRKHGGNVNDFRNAWWGITVFAQSAMGRTLLRFGDRIPPDVKARWQKIFARETAFIRRRFMDPSFENSNVNYPAAFCEAMVLAAKLLDDKTCLDDAAKTAARLKAFVTEDGLLAGEDHPPTFVSPRGCRPVDLGYNCEETIPAILSYAASVGDRELQSLFLDCAMHHLDFLLPDGGLDNSAGSRSAKWTYYGSRTSDGMLPMLAALAKSGRPGAVRAIDRHLKLLERCTLANGVLAGGLNYAAAQEPGCLHHGFAHAKALVDLLLSDAPESAPDALLPCERLKGLVAYPSMDVHLASIGPWRATFSANDAFSGPPSVTVSGGSPTLLWHADLGLVIAGTMSDYTLVEEQNMQELLHEDRVLTTTPHFLQGKKKSCADRSVAVSAEERDGCISYQVKGGWFSADWLLDDKGLHLSGRTNGDGRFVLPIVVDPCDGVELCERGAIIRKPTGQIKISASQPLSLQKTDRGDRAFSPVAGLLTAQLFVEIDAARELSLSITVRRTK